MKNDKLKLKVEGTSDTYGRFILEPLERGFGTTVGNSLRRVLLSSLEGAAVTSVKINGVDHEFSTLPGVVEDVLDIILNIKELVIKSYSSTPKEIHLDVKKKGEVRAEDIEHDAEIEIINKDHLIATLAKDGKLAIDLTVEKGKGFIPAERNKKPDQPLNVIAIDSIFSPVRKVNYTVTPVRVGQVVDYDRLNLEVWTSGSITAEEAVRDAAKQLVSHFALFEKQLQPQDEETAEKSEEEGISLSVLNMNVDDFELSARSQNCLKKANIKTVGQLVELGAEKLMKIKNLGQKSYDEIIEKLAQYKISLTKSAS